ncbi:DUF5107 domain-containing protein [Haoranjiania flava]|uniref:DUF5107 domain-containing protein n=1 Tax=Haoranjiania flava TaxID=1856322 RepID=A0AAE3LKK1_9BACT|nr:DUF5107 domain-containing protein [Haoranjiania flava]MCU7695007.1 DUF5107 domain-containing protein [Haoranjiania flava]
MKVHVWCEKIVIPTYETGAPEKNPLFLEKRVYQGSSGVVYPHAVVESISDEKKDKEYNAVFLENNYLKIMILPELGGRVQRAYDKIQKRDFVYYNQVIKPALVGLTGPWISGGIEFNWPQHHRPSTFQPVDFAIEEHEDGSATVWVNEIEVMFRTKGTAGFTLYPDKAYLEIKGKLFNRTQMPQTFLWWANPAVKVSAHYQSIFPPDVYAVFDHGKRDVSSFPIAKGVYYKVDYAPGTDISRYDTIPVPTSYMAIESAYDFIGCYEHDIEAGMLHVADHHFSPGKKQWTWGNGDFGFTWDRHLTDEDGPYIELMTGVYTDNQPDFTWLMPNEEKTFEQYFMPFAKTGGVKNATKEALINIVQNNNGLLVNVYATAVYTDCKVSLYHKGELVKEFIATISPTEIFSQQYTANIPCADLTEWKFIVEHNGKILVEFQQEAKEEKEVPPAATAALSPKDIASVEELYLNGLHLEQYRHATFNPIDYYQEGLLREPANVQCNNAMGLLLLRRGRFGQAEHYFRTAIKTLTKRNPNPFDGEPYYNLGVCLKLQGKEDAAYDAFYKAVWNDAWQHAGFLQLAKIKTRQEDYKLALYLAEKSLVRNYHSIATRHLKAILLRKSGNPDKANHLVDESLQLDIFNFGCWYEKYLLEKDDAVLKKFIELMRNALNNYLELSLDYADAGLYEEAATVINTYIQHNENVSPLCYYYLGYFTGYYDEVKAKEFFDIASKLSAAYVFPNKLEEINILTSAIKRSAHNAKAYYYLGNLWYDKRQYDEAIVCWEKAIALDNTFATPFRNLSLAYFNKKHDQEKSLEYLEKAFLLDETDARVLMELDQLYKMLGKPYQQRLTLLEKHLALTESRDDLYLERITLYNNLENFEKSKALLAQRKFHPWEGGEGKVLGQFILSYTELAKKAILANDHHKALQLLSSLEKYPENLGEGKLYNAQENDVYFLKALALEGLGATEEARNYFLKVTAGISEPVQAIYYNDPQPDKIFYQGLAWYKLNAPEKAKAIYEKFINFGREHYNDEVKIDYFAVSLPDLLVFDLDLDKRNKNHARYLIGLGYLGLGAYDRAKEELRKVVEADINHQGAASYIRMIPFMKEVFNNDL